MGIKTDLAFIDVIDTFVTNAVIVKKKKVVRELADLGFTLEQVYKHGLFDRLPHNILSSIIYLEVYATVKMFVADMLQEREGFIVDFVLYDIDDDIEEVEYDDDDDEEDYDDEYEKSKIVENFIKDFKRIISISKTKGDRE